MTLVGEELKSIQLEAKASPKLSTAKLSEIYLKSPNITEIQSPTNTGFVAKATPQALTGYNSLLTTGPL